MCVDQVCPILQDTDMDTGKTTVITERNFVLNNGELRLLRNDELQAKLGQITQVRSNKG